MIKDMTQGRPYRLILSFSVPLLIGNLFQQLLTISDTIIVGNTLGQIPLGAVGNTGAAVFAIFGFFWGMTGGLGIITSQRFGAGDHKGLRASVTNGTYICLVSTIVITAISAYFAPDILRLMRTPEDLFPDSVTYLRIISIGLVATVFYNYATAVCRALGDSRTPLYFVILATFINIGLDLLFIKYFGWGVAGAAWATVIAQLFSAIGCITYLKMHSTVLQMSLEDWKLNKDIWIKEVKQALPMSFHFTIISVGHMVLQIGVNDQGTDSVTAMTIAARMGSIIIMPMGAFAIALSTFVAQNFGAKLYSRIRQGIKQTIVIQMCWCLMSCLLLWTTAAWLAQFFMDQESSEICNMVQIFFNVECCFYPVLGILFSLRNTLQGLGRTLMPFLSAIGEMFARIAATILLASSLGFAGLALVSPLAWLTAVIMMGPSYILWKYQTHRRDA